MKNLLPFEARVHMQKTQPQPLTITISEEAANHIRHFAKESGKPNSNLRVGVKGDECSGLTYILDLADEPGENDKVIEEHGLQLYVDKKSYVFLAGTILEYSGGLNGKGFVFNNPNAKTTCGCGTSFSV
jgi:iron-sulfur cluster assembly protein